MCILVQVNEKRYNVVNKKGGEIMGGKASAASKNKYNAKAYDRINFIVPKGQKDIIKAAAEAAGQSTNAYIVQAVRDRIEREKA